MNEQRDLITQRIFIERDSYDSGKKLTKLLGLNRKHLARMHPSVSRQEVTRTSLSD